MTLDGKQLPHGRPDLATAAGIAGSVSSLPGWLTALTSAKILGVSSIVFWFIGIAVAAHIVLAQGAGVPTRRRHFCAFSASHDCGRAAAQHVGLVVCRAPQHRL